jgi:hypothetical protein
VTFTIKNMKQFNALVSALKEVNEEVVFHAKNGTLSVRAWATTTVTGLVFDIPIEGEQTAEDFAVRVEDLQKAIKSLGDEALFAVREDRVTISAKNKIYEIGCYDPSYVKELPRSVTPGVVKIGMNSKEFEEFVKELSTFAQTVLFSHEKKKLVARSNEAGIKNSVMIDIVTTSEETARCHYGLQHLKATAALAKAFPSVTVSFGTNYPLHLQYEGEGASVQFFLAPISVQE